MKRVKIAVEEQQSQAKRFEMTTALRKIKFGKNHRKMGIS
jgi:hypothetical protein